MLMSHRLATPARESNMARATCGTRDDTRALVMQARRDASTCGRRALTFGPACPSSVTYGDVISELRRDACLGGRKS